MKTVFKCAAVIVGAFLLLGFGFIEPSRNLEEPTNGLLIILGVAVSAGVAVAGCMYVTRRKEVEHED